MIKIGFEKNGCERSHKIQIDAGTYCLNRELVLLFSARSEIVCVLIKTFLAVVRVPARKS